MHHNTPASPGVQTIRNTLFSLADPAYKTFQSRLLPSVPPESMIGVRTPDIRRYAGELAGTRSAEVFLSSLPHAYFDENQLHAFLLCRMRDFQNTIYRLNVFLPYVDNWATCDQMNPPVLKKDLPSLFTQVESWLSSGKEYTVRYGLVTLMRFYLRESFSPEVLSIAVRVLDDHRVNRAYYVQMALAWFLATALSFRYEQTRSFLEAHSLPPDISRMTAQKVRDSIRMTGEQKDLIGSLLYHE